MGPDQPHIAELVVNNTIEITAELITALRDAIARELENALGGWKSIEPQTIDFKLSRTTSLLSSLDLHVVLTFPDTMSDRLAVRFQRAIQRAAKSVLGDGAKIGVTIMFRLTAISRTMRLLYIKGDGSLSYSTFGASTEAYSFIDGPVPPWSGPP